MKSGFIFDFDGVICDSEKYHYLAWAETASSLDIEFSRAEYIPFQSTGRKAVITYLLEKANLPFSENLFSRLSAVKSSAFARLTSSIGENDIIKGVDDFIKKLYASGALLAVASSASTARIMLKSLSLSKYFSSIIDGTDKIVKKPSPDVFLQSAKNLGLTPSQCIVFEDSPAGVKAGIDGGFSVIGIGNALSEINIPIHKDFTTVIPLFFDR